MINFPTTRLIQFFSTTALAAILAGCAPDLIVRHPVYDDGAKTGYALIKNIGNRDAGRFLVYFDANDPISKNHIPQVSVEIPNLRKGASTNLVADFSSLAHLDNNYLRNFHSITVRVDPKNMVAESNERNNTESSPCAITNKGKFIFEVQTGGFGIQGYGSQGPTGNTLTLEITACGQALFDDYTAVILGASTYWPTTLAGTKVRLLRGRGNYDFASGSFVDLKLDVEVTDPSGVVTTVTHDFTGNTSAPLEVPVGATPTSINLQLSITPPFSIDLGGGYFGSFHIDASQLTSAVNVP